MEQIIEQLKQEIKQQHAKETRSLTQTLQAKDNTIDTLKNTLEESKNTILSLQLSIIQQNEKVQQEKNLLEQKVAEAERNVLLIKEQLELQMKEKEAKEKEAKEKEKEGIIVISEDPRVRNRPLPNDAVLTYEYGARAYISDIYNGFVWRNGFWYRLPLKNKFKPHSIRKLRKWNVSEYADADILKKNVTIHQVESDVDINDSYVPVFLNEIRYFIRFMYSSYSNNNIQYLSAEGANIYIPHLQGVIKIKITDRLLSEIVHEDPRAFTEKPKPEDIYKWNNYIQN
jgi:hypothetical protein